MKNDAGKCFQHYQDNAVETHPNNDNKGNGAEACPMMLRKVTYNFLNNQYWCRGWSQNSTQLTMQMKNTTINCFTSRHD